MRLFFVKMIFLALILLLGCVSKEPSIQYEKQQKFSNCAEYCNGIDKEQCNGTWEINGEYPNCNCFSKCIPYNKTYAKMVVSSSPRSSLK